MKKKESKGFERTEKERVRKIEKESYHLSANCPWLSEGGLLAAVSKTRFLQENHF